MKYFSVFGGTGFVGSEFVRLAREDDSYVYVIPKKSKAPASSDILYLISTVDNYNVHSNPLLDVKTNLVWLLEVLKETKKRYENDFVFNFVSSWFVYGETEQPAKEISPCNPKGFYSITKRAAEQLLISYCETFDIPYRIFRLPNVLGLGDTKVSAKKNALQFLIKEMIAGNPIKLYYGGNFYRDYMDVRDVADALLFLMSGSEVNQVYNICDEQSSRLFANVFNYCYLTTGSKSKVTNVDEVEFHKAVQVKSMQMDHSKLTSLGWTRQYDLYADTLAGIIKGYNEIHTSSETSLG